MVRAKFGPVPEEVIAKIEALESQAEIEALSRRLLVANTLPEMGLSEP